MNKLNLIMRIIERGTISIFVFIISVHLSTSYLAKLFEKNLFVETTNFVAFVYISIILVSTISISSILNKLVDLFFIFCDKHIQ